MRSDVISLYARIIDDCNHGALLLAPSVYNFCCGMRCLLKISSVTKESELEKKLKRRMRRMKRKKKWRNPSRKENEERRQRIQQNYAESSPWELMSVNRTNWSSSGHSGRIAGTLQK